MPKIFIGVPCLDYVRTQTVQTLLDIEREQIGKVHIEQNSLIHIARQRLANLARELKYEYILFVDSDMIFNPIVISGLLMHDKDIIGCLFNRRALPPRPLVYVKGKQITQEEIPKELFECSAMGMGCILVKTKVFDQMEMPHFFYKSWTKEHGGHGEDIWFFNQAKKAGFQAWCDPNLKVGHIGNWIF